MLSVRIGLVGDYSAGVLAHQAIPHALKLAGDALGVTVAADWLPTQTLTQTAQIHAYDGLWCVPGSPYRSLDGALLAIQHAREQGVAFLGTCGGFQHAVLEYARNVLGWHDAEHGETAPQARRVVIAPLSCALVEAVAAVRLVAGSRIAAAYGLATAEEGYHCRYGLNPQFRDALTAGPLRATAEDAAGDVRAVELDAHPFFVASLFQPERAALRGEVPPLVQAFVAACCARVGQA